MAQSVIIVGAGIIGAATALQLARAGARVTVVAAGGGDATAAAFGWINASFYLDDDHHRLRVLGMAAWHRLLADVPVSVDWSGCLCWDMAGDDLGRTYDQLKGHGYPVRRLTREAVAAMEPGLAALPEEALFFPQEGAAPSGDVAAALLLAAQGHGARVIRNVAVTKVLSGKAAGVETTHGTLHADQVVLAAGTGTPALAATMGAAVPLVPRPAYILRTMPTRRMVNHVLATPEGEIRQEPNGQILMPVAISHQGDAAERLEMSPDAAADAAMVRLRGMFRDADDLQWAEVIRAERPVPQDGLPIIGSLGAGVYAAVLHSGITLGPLVGELVAKDLMGAGDNETAAVLAPYRPDRFA